MMQEEHWILKYNEVIAFIVKEYRKPSKHYRGETYVSFHTP